MGIIDGHSHIRISNFNDNIKELLKNYKINAQKNDIDKSVISIDPFIKENTCLKNHPTKIFPYSNDMMTCICQKCGKITYNGDDYYRKYNDVLLSNCNDDFFYVFLMLSICQTTIQNNINFFIEKYGSKISGLKLYTTFSSISLDEIKIDNKGLPCLIHCSKYNNQIPSTMLKFIENYDGNVILAHFAALDYQALKKIKNMNNVYVDISPAYQIYKECIETNKKSCLLNNEGISSTIDLYDRLFDNFDIKRIIWGTDYPYSNIKDEIRTVKSYSLTKNEYDLITKENIKRIIKK